MHKTLLIIEPNAQLGMIQSLLSAGLMLDSACDICIIGQNCTHIADKIQHTQISQIFTIDTDDADQSTPIDIYLSLKDKLNNYTNILMAATSFGRSCIPYIAGKLLVSPITDIIEIVSKNQFKRPIYAGNAIQSIQNKQEQTLLTIRTTAFEPCDLDDHQPPIESVERHKDNRITVKDKKVVSDRPDLMAAKVVVSGGAGVSSKDNFKLIEQLADKLGAAVGASRAAVDAGYIANDHQVGQTGKIIAPDVYIAVGISGAIQHMAGMKDSRTIVAINNDADAPIFKVADIGYCGDLFEILPEMIAHQKT